MSRTVYLIGTCLTLGLVLLPGPVSQAAQFGFSAQGKFTFTEGSDQTYEMNRMNRGDNPFSAFQLLVISRAHVDENVDLFLEVPVDADATSSTFLTYLRPFVRLSRLGGQPWLNLQAGRLPTLFGAYGERTNSTEKALIGVPLLFYYHTAVRNDFAVQSTDYFFQPGVRGAGYRPAAHPGGLSFVGMPLIYDACWDTGAELYGGTPGGLQYSVATTLGTVSAPATSAANINDGYQFIGRLGYAATDGPLFGLRVGASGSVGPYLKADIVTDPNFPAGHTAEDYLNTSIGADLSYARGPWQLFAEAGHLGYEVPNVSPLLTATSYYVELVRDFGPMWTTALRQEASYFNDITSSTGVTGSWDYDIQRIEASLGFRFQRSARLRVAYQNTHFPEARHLDGHLVAVQLHVWTR